MFDIYEKALIYNRTRRPNLTIRDTGIRKAMEIINSLFHTAKKLQNPDSLIEILNEAKIYYNMMKMICLVQLDAKDRTAYLTISFLLKLHQMLMIR